MPTTGNRPAGSPGSPEGLRAFPRGDNLVRDVVLLAVAAVCSWLLAKLLVPSDVDAAVLPTLILMGRRHFKRGKREGQHEPKHPAVMFVLAAWTEARATSARPRSTSHRTWPSR